MIVSPDTTTTVSGTTRVKANEGYYEFTDFIIVTTPGSKTDVLIESSGISANDEKTIDIPVQLR